MKGRGRKTVLTVFTISGRPVSREQTRRAKHRDAFGHGRG